jgi:glycosyltransferase involved in cell wall biosynthesis
VKQGMQSREEAAGSPCDFASFARLKICHIVPSLEPHHGGPSRSVLALSTALARAGHSVDLFATGRGSTGTQSAGNLRRTLFPRDRPQRFCPSAGLRQALRGHDAAVLHHHALWLRTLHYTHDAARARAVFVVSPRGMMSAWAWRHHRWRKQFARAVLHPGAMEAADGWHATSSAEEADIRALGFSQPVCVAPNGVDLPSEIELESARAHWHQACPATASQPVALFYSRFHRKKRVLELIDLWLREGPRDWLLLLVGIPEDYTPKALSRHIAGRARASQIQIFSGAGRPAPYAAASIFLLPSHNENFGLVVAEAMAHGVPVLVTDSTPWERVNREECGWCVPWGQYGEALRDVTAITPDALRRRGLRARDWVGREFSWDKSARRLGEFYARLGARQQ